MSKQLNELFEKAQENGLAIKNGRKRDFDFGYVYIGDLEEQWAIEIYGGGKKLELRHWGTELITCTKYEEKWFIDLNSFYCESKSDRDGLMWLFNKLNIDHKVSYKPSEYKAYLYNNKNEVVSII